MDEEKHFLPVAASPHVSGPELDCLPLNVHGACGSDGEVLSMCFPNISVCVEVVKWASSRRKAHLRGTHRMASMGLARCPPWLSMLQRRDSSAPFSASAAEARGCGSPVAAQSDPRRAP